MEKDLRALLDSAQEIITDKEEELRRDKQSKIDSFIELATNNQKAFYESVIESFIYSYVSNYTMKDRKENTFKLEYNDSYTEDYSKIIKILKETNAYSTAYSKIIVFATVTITSNFFRFPNDSIIFIDDKTTFEKSSPVLINRDDFTKVNMYVTYNPSKITITATADTIKALMEKILNDDPTVTKFKSDKIIRTINHAKFEMNAYDEVLLEEKKLIDSIESQADANLKDVSLNICRQLINNYDPSVSCYITRIPFELINSFKSYSDQEPFSSLLEYQGSKPDNTIILLSSEAKLQYAYTFVDFKKLEQIIQELGSTVTIDSNNLVISTSTHKFSNIVFNGNRIKKTI